MSILKKGDNGPKVELLQSILKKLEIFKGNVDGNFGIETEKAVVKFQKMFKLKENGIVGENTLKKLYPYINGYKYYIIESGDTVYNIAKKFNTNVNYIIVANPNTNMYNLKIGDTVVVPFGTVVQTDIKYTYEILNMDILALKKIYPFLKYGNVGKSVLNRNIDTYIRPQYSNENAPKTIVIPEKASTNKQVIEYLKNRGIDEEIINDCINKKIIYQENKTNNAVFLGYDNDNNIKYAGCRSTNEKRIMRDAKGSSKEYSFRMLGAEECNSLHIFESSIDLLSYATLLKNKGYDYTNQNLLSLAGVYQPSSNIEQSKVPIAVQNFLNKNTNIKDIVLHFDNDIAGRNATKAMIYALDKYNVYDIPAPYGKDINDYLCYSIGLKNRQEIDRYKMKKEQNRVPM